MATYYVDLVNGDDANDGSTWALAKKTINSSFEYPAGSIVKIAKTPDIIASGVNAAFECDSSTITLLTPLTKDIEHAIGNTWTSVVNVTTGVASLSYSKFSGATNSPQRFAISSIFTTGKIGYKALPETLDLSTFTKISLWLATSNITGGLNTADKLRLCLCSDLFGDVIVNTLSFPALYSINCMCPFVLDNGSPLGNNINSIAFYMNGEPGTATIWFQNIFATNVITHKTLVGKSDKAFYAIRNIVANVIELDSKAGYGNIGHFIGTTETAELYYRNALEYNFQYATLEVFKIKLGIENTATQSEFQFGWNTITDEQDGETCIDGLSNFGVALNFFQYGYVKITNLHIFRFTTGLTNTNTPRVIYENCIFCACNDNIILLSGAYQQMFINSKSYCSGSQNFSIDSCNNEFINCEIGKGGALSNVVNLMLNPSSSNNYFKNVTFASATGHNTLGDIKGNGHIFEECEFRSPSMPFTPNINGEVKFINCIIPKITEGTVSEAYGVLGHAHEISFINIDNIVGNSFTYIKNAKLRLQTEIKPVDGDSAWFLETFNNYGRASEQYPGKYKIAEIDVEANKEVIIRLESGVSAPLGNVAKIFIKKDITLGINEDIYSEAYVNSNFPVQFHFISVLVTPTSTGVIELYIAFWHDVYFSKIEII